MPSQTFNTRMTAPCRDCCEGNRKRGGNELPRRVRCVFRRRPVGEKKGQNQEDEAKVSSGAEESSEYARVVATSRSGVARKRNPHRDRLPGEKKEGRGGSVALIFSRKAPKIMGKGQKDPSSNREKRCVEPQKARRELT